MILQICLRYISSEEEGHGYAVVDRRRACEGAMICYNSEWPSLYCVPSMQDAITRHVVSNALRWKNGDMFLVFKMGKRPPVIKAIAMFECMDGGLTPRTISDYPDDVKTIIARLREEA